MPGKKKQATTDKPATTSPLMEQYLAIKAQQQDAILFFRMGDFYEMFYEDAKTASDVLGLTLTSRAHGKSASVPLAGFPYHSLDTYLAKMIRAGYKVAICEQVEDPKKAKVVVKREVVEMVTPGTVIADELLESKRNNFLLCLFADGEVCGLSFLDVSTGEFSAAEFSLSEALEQVGALAPAEVLISDEQKGYFEGQFERPVSFTITSRDGWVFTREYGYEILIEHFGTLSMKGFGCEDMAAGIAAAGAVLHYLRENQKSDLGFITRLQRFSSEHFMVLDSSTRRNLELTSSISQGGARGTLLSVVDESVTAMGGRMLLTWINRPLLVQGEIVRRHDAVEELKSQSNMRGDIRGCLKKMGDLERLMARISMARANARDLSSLKHSMKLVGDIRRTLSAAESELIAHICENLTELTELVELVDAAIVEEPPLSLTDGGIIRPGYDQELDELRKIATSGKDWIARLQNTEREQTGIPSLKVGYNKVFGYYIEVTRPHLSKVPASFIRKQTLVNAERFITPELKEYEEKVVGAEERIFSREYDLFNQVRSKAAEYAGEIQEDARLIAQLDCLASFAETADRYNYVRPEITRDNSIVISEGRHPVVELLLPRGEAFVPNDVSVDNDENQILVITGPNMAGKSTYLRQVGLLVLMAQMGSFVPARSARIGLVDKIFTRVGASDNLAGGESTFLVEMNETANILNNASSKSLIILDEIGRGTSTFDGLSIAWAVTEYIHNNQKVSAKTLFATHYHELTELELMLPRVKNYNVAVKEWGDHIVFLRKIIEGGCDHSYGIQVAKLAGLPRPVIKRAREVLANLESDALTQSKQPKLARRRDGEPAGDLQMDMFRREEASLREKLAELDLDNMTPLMALNKLQELMGLIR